MSASEHLNALEKAPPQIMSLRILSGKGAVQIMPFRKLGGKCHFLLRFCTRNWSETYINILGRTITIWRYLQEMQILKLSQIETEQDNEWPYLNLFTASLTRATSVGSLNWTSPGLKLNVFGVQVAMWIYHYKFIHTQQKSERVLGLAQKIKWILNWSKSVNASVSADAQCEYGLTRLTKY